MKRFASLALLGLTGLAACTDESVSPLSPEGRGPSAADISAPSFARMSATGEFVLLGTAGRLPADLEQQIAALGGQIVQTHEAIGVAVVSGSSPSFRADASRIRGVDSVTPDFLVRWVDQSVEGRALAADLVPAADVGSEVASIGDTNIYYSWQWAPAAIQAPEAWNAGFTGAGVRVAVLDGGIFSGHPDLAPNLDVAASRSFTTGAWNTDTGTFWHGTHVAGIIASAANNIGTVGIAPGATLVGVKVLHNGTGSFASIIDGIIYAATPAAEGGAGANVINMSLGASIDSLKYYRAGR